MSTIDELDETLLLYGVFTILGHKRRETASKLFSDGVTVVEVESLGDHCKATTDNEASASKVLYSILVDAEKRKPALADLARRSELRQAHATTPNADSRRPIGPVEGEDPEKWDRDRQCRMAAALIRSDRWTAGRVARELGVTAKEAAKMAQRGEEMLASPMVGGVAISPQEAEKARKQEVARSSDFRQRMRDDKARSAAGRRPVGIDWKKIAWHKRNLLDVVAERGEIDIAECARDKSRLGALAELEHAGEILRAGPANAEQVQPYDLAKDDAQRAQFRERFRLWGQEDMRRGNARKVGMEANA